MRKSTILSLSFFCFLFLSSSLLSSNSMDSTYSIISDKQEKGKFKPDENNLMQKHAFFFDRNQDGSVHPWETYQGLRALGAGVLLSTACGIFINGAFSQLTRPGKFPSLLFPIELRNIVLAKIKSGTDTYDEKGRFIEEKFENIFRDYARTHSDALTRSELSEMRRAHKKPKDYFGWISTWTQWSLTYHLFKDEHGLLKKDTLRGLYDGSTFEKREKELKEKRNALAKKKASI
ncbi:probable peroxygenase 4 isoform X1 [Manihot esculenta]|uniref:EF-hand domain-containing protein n=1 Tax=Manihot esculenta TaxID=3983 RepID=A0A2C9U662_MANES|nr:probable peroxygenase 4 isoform X1 [Manihot esculenta]